MSVILCDRCGDGIDLTTETVCLPYLCQACEDASKVREAAKPATPAKNKRGKFSGVQTATEICDKIFGVPTAATLPVEQDCDCGCGTATVEATTDLIADLTEQLAAEKSLASVLLKSAEVLADDNAKYKNLVVEAREDAARFFTELEAERSSATRAQIDITLLEGRLVQAKYDLQAESEMVGHLRDRCRRAFRERDGVKAEMDVVVSDLKRDLSEEKYETRCLRNDRTFYKNLAIERRDHPFSNLWKWFKRLF